MTDSREHDQVTSTERHALMPKRRWFRRVLIVVCVLLIGLVVLVALTPTLISAGAGKRMVMDAVSDRVAGRIDADAVHVSWTGGQSLTGVVIRDADGNEVARIDRVDLPDVSLLSLIRGGLGLGELNVNNVTGQVIGYDDGTTNLQRALAPTSAASTKPQTTPTNQPAAKPQWPAGLSFTFTLRDFDVTYRAADATEPIRLVIPEAKLTANDPTHLLMNIGAEFSRARQKGSLNADAKIDQLFDANGVYQSGSATAHVDGTLTDLPVDLIDALSQQDGRLVSLLGPVMNGKVLADVTTAGGSATLNADSDTLHVNADVAFDDTGLKQHGESTIRYTLEPKALAALTAAQGQADTVLQKPVEIVIALNKLDLPFSDQGVDLSKLNADLGMTIGDANLKIDGVGDVSLAATTGSIKTTQLSQSLDVRFNTTSSLNQKPGDVSLTIKLNDLMNDQGRFDPTRLTTRVNGELTNAPVAAILDQLIPDLTKGLATRTLGRAIDATVSLNTRPADDGQSLAGNFELDVLTRKSETDLNATLIGSFGYSKQAIYPRLADGSFAKLTLTQDLLDAIRKAYQAPAKTEAGKPSADQTRLTLGDPVHVRFDVTRLAAALNADPDGGYQLDPSTIDADASLSSPKMIVHENGKLAATLGDLLVSVKNSTGIAGDTQLTLSSKIDYPTEPGEEPKPGSIQSDTTVTGITQADGQLTLADATIKTDTTIRQAPIDLIDSLFGLNGELVAAVGPRALLTLDGSYTPASEGATGGLDLFLKNRLASADMKLLVEDGKWTLKNDAPLSFMSTQSFSQVILKKVNPFLGNAVSVRLPVDVTILRDGFSAPVQNITLNDISANIKLDLGQLDLRGEGGLKQLLKVLKVDNQSLAKVSFSPVSISLTGGKLSYDNLVMGIDTVKFGFSGSVDLNNKALDMQLTIPGSSLAQIDWLGGRFSADEAIVIPLTGTYDKPKLDMKLLTGEIAKKAIQGELNNAAGDKLRDQLGDKAGEAVGGLLNELLTGQKPTQDQADQADQPDAKDGEAKAPLTDEERAARRERRRLRRERLEREKKEREAQEQQQQP